MIEDNYRGKRITPEEYRNHILPAIRRRYKVGEIGPMILAIVKSKGNSSRGEYSTATCAFLSDDSHAKQFFDACANSGTNVLILKKLGSGVNCHWQQLYSFGNISPYKEPPHPSTEFDQY